MRLIEVDEIPTNDNQPQDNNNQQQTTNTQQRNNNKKVDYTNMSLAEADKRYKQMINDDSKTKFIYDWLDKSSKAPKNIDTFKSVVVKSIQENGFNQNDNPFLQFVYRNKKLGEYTAPTIYNLIESKKLNPFGKDKWVVEASLYDEDDKSNAIKVKLLYSISDDNFKSRWGIDKDITVDNFRTKGGKFATASKMKSLVNKLQTQTPDDIQTGNDIISQSFNLTNGIKDEDILKYINDIIENADFTEGADKDHKPIIKNAINQHFNDQYRGIFQKILGKQYNREDDLKKAIIDKLWEIVK